MNDSSKMVSTFWYLKVFDVNIIAPKFDLLEPPEKFSSTSFLSSNVEDEKGKKTCYLEGKIEKNS